MRASRANVLHSGWLHLTPVVGMGLSPDPLGGSAERDEATARVAVRLLWTGGWDSSFRLLQALLVEYRPVQPLYVLSHGRRSTAHELRAMAALRRGVLARLEDPSLLAPTLVYLRSDFPVLPEVVALHAQVASDLHLGSQYLWLPSIAQALDWDGVELSIERLADTVGLIPYLQDEHGRRGTRPGAELFSRFSFPVLHLTKADMAGIAREHGFLDLLSLRWFCHDPLGDKPCGRCRPCRYARWEGQRPANRTAVRTRRALRAGRRLVRAIDRGLSGVRQTRPRPRPSRRR